MADKTFEYNPMNDVLFKFIFGIEEHKWIAISFLNAVLNWDKPRRTIKDFEFGNVEFVPPNDERKLTRLDIYCVLDTGERIDIEV